jgi:hypothetical protein
VVVFGSRKTHQQRTVPIPAVLLEPLARRCATLDVYSGLFDEDLGTFAERTDAAHAAHNSAPSVGGVWASEKISDLGNDSSAADQENSGGAGGARTHDPGIMSPLL